MCVDIWQDIAVAIEVHFIPLIIVTVTEYVTAHTNGTASVKNLVKLFTGSFFLLLLKSKLQFLLLKIAGCVGLCVCHLSTYKSLPQGESVSFQMN